MPKSKYDEGYKKLFKIKHTFIHFLQKYVGEPWTYAIKPEDMELCSPEFIMGNYTKRNADIVWKISLGEDQDYIYVIQELQSDPDNTMPFRTFIYSVNMMVNIFEAIPKKKRKKKSFRLPVVISIVYYNGRKKWDVPTYFSEYQKGFTRFEGYAADFRYYFVNLNSLEEEFIQSTNTLVDNILSLDKAFNEDRWLMKLEEISMRITSLSGSDQEEFWNWLKEVLAKSIEEEENINKIIALLQKKEEKPMISSIERIMKKEKKKARRQGRAEGLQQMQILYEKLQESNQKDIFPQVLFDEKLRQELCDQYNIN